ncbi:MAG: globin domain-containing protein [Anaerolineae bacterium]
MNSLNDAQRELVTTSFARLVPEADHVAGLFYEALWEIAPETRTMFAAIDMGAQGLKLMQTLGVAVRALHDLPSIDAYLVDLGARHIRYGVSKAHYALVKLALLRMLEQCLERDFTPAMHDAWGAAYDLIAAAAMRAYEMTS